MKKKTDYDNVYWIPKGFEYHPNEFAEIDGYIWYDETEQSSPVYSSAEQAKEALENYCDELLKELSKKWFGKYDTR
jgi:hypothetical protein